MKYQIGDKAKVIDAEISAHGFGLGDIVEIKEIDTEWKFNECYLAEDWLGNTWWITDGELEHVETRTESKS